MINFGSHDHVRVLRWPWALSETSETVSLASGRGSISFQGAAFLACPRGMRILPIGGSADLARLARTEDSDLYELPHGRTGSVESALEMQGYAGGQHRRWHVGLDGARLRFGKGPGREQEESIESIAVFDWWDAFDDLLRLRRKPDGAISWESVVGWLGQLSRSSEPRRALIVEIAEKLSSSIGDHTRHLRRILLRRRDLVPVNRIQQIDDECLRWYIRQPGETLAEKAGHRQEIMSVVRQETFDTLENRVLKDFLGRCIRAASRYVQRFQRDYANSDRLLLVKRYARISEQALQLPEFEDVGRPRPGAQPNYVLQSDRRYRDVWRWYQKVLRNQDSEEQIWNWQGRLWADVCRLLVGAASHYLTSAGGSSGRGHAVLTRSPFFVQHEGKLGSRLARSWAPGPFLVRRAGALRGVLSLVDALQAEDHGVVAGLAQAGGHLYLVREAIGDDGQCDVLVVWAINGMSTANDLDAERMAQSAAAALDQLRTKGSTIASRVRFIDGLVLVSELGRKNAVHSTFDRERGEGAGVAVVTIGSDPRSWDDAVLEIAASLEQWL